MLRSLKDLIGYEARCTEGDIGPVADLYFDDLLWTIRYFVIDAGGWLQDRRVLISPVDVGEPGGADSFLPLHVTKSRVEHAPEIDWDLPVSRQHEIELARYYNWTPYWAPAGASGAPVPPSAAAPGPDDRERDRHLRSVKEVTGYKVVTADGEGGCVDDFIGDAETWVVRYMVVDTDCWLPARKVVIAPEWTGRVDWSMREIQVDLSQAAIECSPVYDPFQPINRDYELQLYDYYGRPKYWE